MAASPAVDQTFCANAALSVFAILEALEAAEAAFTPLAIPFKP